MKNFLRFTLAICLFALSINLVNAEDKILSATVRIISFSLTENNHVIEKSIASGTVISRDGLILTNHHVVTDQYDENYDAFAICLVFDEQEKPECIYTANLIAKDKSLDIALLQVNERDIYGEFIALMPHLTYKDAKLPNVSDDLEIVGFPGIGGDTITKTEGQVSGFDDKEGIKQIKTDAVISTGNSGGTAICNGEFIGVPSYLKSYYSTLGYVVPLTEINPWLKKNINKDPQKDQFVNDLLETLLVQKHQAEKNRKHTSVLFPFYEIEIPEPWKIDFINDANLEFYNTVQGAEIGMSIAVNNASFEINDDFIDFILKKIEKNYHRYTNYKREEYELDGKDGLMITYDSGNDRYYYIMINIDNAILNITYNISLENKEETEEAIAEILNSFKFVDGENNLSKDTQFYEQTNPDVSLKTFGDIFVSPIYDSTIENVVVYFENPQSFEQAAYLAYYHLSKDYWDLTKEEILEKEIKYQYGKLLNKYDDIVIDGLEGFAYTHSFKGDDFNQTRKRTVVNVFTDKKYFEFVYEDLEENYNKNIDDFLRTLESFEYDGEENLENKGEYNIPKFKTYYEDINNYIYEEKINALASKNILQIEGRYYYPEYKVYRMDALKTIINSKIFIDDGRKSTETEDAISNENTTSVFTDIVSPREHQILNYALKNGIISSADKFRPNTGLTLAEALKMLCKAYELPVWDPPYKNQIEWYLPYLYKAHDLGVIPFGVEHDDVLTRGQFAYLIYRFVSTVGERSDI